MGGGTGVRRSDCVPTPARVLRSRDRPLLQRLFGSLFWRSTRGSRANIFEGTCAGSASHNAVIVRHYFIARSDTAVVCDPAVRGCSRGAARNWRVEGACGFSLSHLISRSPLARGRVTLRRRVCTPWDVSFAPRSVREVFVAERVTHQKGGGRGKAC